MNRTVSRLLKSYLARNAWPYALLGVAQYFLTGGFWLGRVGRVPIAGMALGLWGAVAAINANNLVWRCVPIGDRDAAVFRWWAMAGAPGIYLTLITGITWVSQQSSGFPTPTTDVIFEGIFAGWAVVGVVAALFRAPSFYIRGRVAKPYVMMTCAIILLGYGIPVGSAARPYSIVFIATGMILLGISAARAYRGRHWRWPDVGRRGSAHTAGFNAMRSAYHVGIWTVLLPLAWRTAVVAAISTALVTVLHFIFPHADKALFWVYFIGISSAGFLLTLQTRSALPALRCLPLGTKQLAGLLLVLGALPGVATVVLTFLINLALLHVDIDFSAFVTFAIIIIGLQALPPGPVNERTQRSWRTRWIPLAQRIFWPAYLGAMSATYSRGFAAWWWFRWPLIALGVGVCLSGYCILVAQLRTGVRPSESEKLFYAR